MQGGKLMRLKAGALTIWGSQDRFPTNVDAAYRALGGK
jgi:hypothetical protein